jgi:hypothetical protein
MAKQKPNPAKDGLNELFKRTETEPAPPTLPDEAPARPESAQPAPVAELLSQEEAELDRTLPVGVGLKASEVAAIDEIAAELGVARNALLRWAVRYFLSEYRAGRAQPDAKPLPAKRERRKRLIMP